MPKELHQEAAAVAAACATPAPGALLEAMQFGMGMKPPVQLLLVAVTNSDTMLRIRNHKTETTSQKLERVRNCESDATNEKLRFTN